MTEPKPKQRKPKVELREPAKPLAKPEERAPLAADHPVMEIFRQAQTGELPPLTTTHHHSPEAEPISAAAPQPKSASGFAPERDFNKRANSLEREALPSGLFPGSSKKIYDALYLRTRGANPPRQRVRASRRDFLDWTDIRNIKTVDGHLRYLMSVGWIVRRWEPGSTEGSEYEVRLLEELPRLTTTPHQSPGDTITQFSGSGTPQFSGSGGEGQTVDLLATSGGDKTSSFKTKDEATDDEAAARLARAFNELTKELTGKETDPGACAKWLEVVEVVATEAKIAAARTTVSSAPAFVAEHLRRRLFKKDKRQLAEETKPGHVSGERASTVDATKCLDCGGSGMWYPDGFEKGVAKCRHEKLREVAAPK